MVEQYKPLSDSQWEGIKAFLDTERKRKIDLRNVVDAIRYIVRCGIQWRALLPCFPKWKSVYYYFIKWVADGTMMEINSSLYVKALRAAFCELQNLKQLTKSTPSTTIHAYSSFGISLTTFIC